MPNKKKKGSKRRRVGAMGLNPSSPVVKIAAVAAGYLLADAINGAIDKAVPDTSMGTSAPTIKMAAELGLGGFLLLSRSSGKFGIVKTAAGGLLAGAGLKRALKKFGVISGYQSTPVIGRHVRGYQSVPVVGGVPPMLSGMPPQLNGYRVNGYQPNDSGVPILGKVGCTGSGITNSGGGGYMN